MVNMTKQILKKVQEQPNLHVNNGRRQEKEEQEELPHTLVASAVSPTGDTIDHDHGREHQ